jgi:Skp family chaperone for outer membrane proteins
MPLTARAQDGNGKIAVVDVEQILNESMAGKSIERQLVNRREAFQKEFAERENNLMNAEKALVEEKNTLTAEEFANKRKAFEKEYLETRNLFQKRRNALDKGLGTALSELRRNIIQVTADIAEEEGYQVVLTRDSVVIVAKEMEITQKVLKRLNKTIQNIKLDMAE